MPKEDVSEDLTAKLRRVGGDDDRALDEVFEATYTQLHLIASSLTGGLPPDASSNATSLVHETYVKFRSSAEQRTWQNSAHFFKSASIAMHDLLVDHARRRHTLKRGGGRPRSQSVEGIESQSNTCEASGELVLLIEALRNSNPETAEIFMLRHYCDLSRKQTSELLGATLRTIDDQTALARAILGQRLRALYTAGGEQDPHDVSTR